MKQKGRGILIGAIMVFAGIVSIPVIYKFASLLGDDQFSTLLVIMIPSVLIGGGFLLIYVTNMLHNPGVDNTNRVNDQSGTAPNDTTKLKRIVIVIDNNGISLNTEGISPQEIITYLELSKYYVITKSIRTGSLIDIVKRE